VSGVQPIEDGLQHGSCLQQDLPVVEAHHFETGNCKRSGSPLVLRCSFWLEVLPTVDLYDQVGFKTGKVGEVWSDGMLTTELEASELAVTEVAPDQVFGVGG
jgi:hypothetical protein